MQNLQPEGVLSRGNHGDGDRALVRLGMKMLGFEPGAEPGIVNFRLVPPEIGRQATLDPQMIQLQFNDRDAFGEVTPHVGDSNVQPRHSQARAMCFDYHTHLLFNL